MVYFFLGMQANVETGLTAAEATAAFEKFGPNELPDNSKSKIMMFLGFFWGPMPCMIWAAIIIELAQAIVTGDGASSVLVVRGDCAFVFVFFVVVK